MSHKKGVSTIVVTVILVALVLIAVGIVWAVVSNIISRGTETIDVTGICVAITVQPTAADCSDPAACVITLERSSSGTDDIGGVKLVFKNATDSSSVIDVPGNIELLVPKRTTVDSILTAPNRVECTIYLVDESGDERLCAQTTAYTI
jgi:hypothetical protein